MDDNMRRMFERRERKVGSPLHPRPSPTPAPAGTMQETVAMAPETAVEPQSELPPSTTPPKPRRPAQAPQEPVGTKRNSIFLSKEQEQWIKALRGRLMVAGQEVSSSEVVRLALDQLRASGMDDGAIHAAIVRCRPDIRPRGLQPKK